jgi:hypothetical protein
VVTGIQNHVILCRVDIAGLWRRTAIDNHNDADFIVLHNNLELPVTCPQATNNADKKVFI